MYNTVTIENETYAMRPICDGKGFTLTRLTDLAQNYRGLSDGVMSDIIMLGVGGIYTDANGKSRVLSQDETADLMDRSDDLPSHYGANPTASDYEKTIGIKVCNEPERIIIVDKDGRPISQPPSA